MGRKHRRRPENPLPDPQHLANRGARRENRGSGEWFVRDITAERALKRYRCPGCSQDILEGQAHVVAWRADHLFGDDAAASERRHWHGHCWRLV